MGNHEGAESDCQDWQTCSWLHAKTWVCMKTARATERRPKPKVVSVFSFDSGMIIARRGGVENTIAKAPRTHPSRRSRSPERHQTQHIESCFPSQTDARPLRDRLREICNFPPQLCSEIAGKASRVSESFLTVESRLRECSEITRARTRSPRASERRCDSDSRSPGRILPSAPEFDEFCSSSLRRM